MKKLPHAAFAAALLFFVFLASLAHADKLAPSFPNGQSLQPPPAQTEAAPDVAQNVDRTETEGDEQNIETSEAQQGSSAPAPLQSAAPHSWSGEEIALIVAIGALILAGVFQAVKSSLS